MSNIDITTVFGITTWSCVALMIIGYFTRKRFPKTEIIFYIIIILTLTISSFWIFNRPESLQPLEKFYLVILIILTIIMVLMTILNFTKAVFNPPASGNLFVSFICTITNKQGVVREDVTEEILIPLADNPPEDENELVKHIQSLWVQRQWRDKNIPREEYTWIQIQEVTIISVTT